MEILNDFTLYNFEDDFILQGKFYCKLINGDILIVPADLSFPMIAFVQTEVENNALCEYDFEEETGTYIYELYLENEDDLKTEITCMLL